MASRVNYDPSILHRAGNFLNTKIARPHTTLTRLLRRRLPGINLGWLVFYLVDTMAELDLQGWFDFLTYIFLGSPPGVNSNSQSLDVAVATSLFNTASASFKERKRNEYEYLVLIRHLVKSGGFPSLRDWAVLMRENQMDIKCDPLWLARVLSVVEFYKFPGYTYNPRLGGVTYNTTSAKLKDSVNTLFSYDGSNRREKFCTFVAILARGLAHDPEKYAEEVSHQSPPEAGKSLIVHGPPGTGLAGSSIVWSAAELSICGPDYICEQLRETSNLYDQFSVQLPLVRQVFRENGITNMVFPTLNFLAAGQYNHNYIKGIPRARTVGLKSVKSKGTFLEFSAGGILDLQSALISGWNQLRENYETSLTEFKQSGFIAVVIMGAIHIYTILSLSSHREPPPAAGAHCDSAGHYGVVCGKLLYNCNGIPLMICFVNVTSL